MFSLGLRHRYGVGVLALLACAVWTTVVVTQAHGASTLKETLYLNSDGTKSADVSPTVVTRGAAVDPKITSSTRLTSGATYLIKVSGMSAGGTVGSSVAVASRSRALNSQAQASKSHPPMTTPRSGSPRRW
jgi:hypothetical protein